ncbi:hypothetical protein EWM64_g9099 [Hericium alpestre]|uniref:Ketoreductase domain-containing protein n=1 Tax=Hericium alpestre TaxID=135208 RepID=A0A4Y9ZKD4_9AGAM|nr:hypothetical protein EWM64_g9099 [Hericium alpestre]
MSSPVVVVTGASKGIGLAITRILLQKFSATVVAISRTRSSDLGDLFKTHGGALIIEECDVADETALRSTLINVEETLGHLDALVLNAGVLEPLGRIGSPESSLDGWRSHFEVNLFSCVNAVKVALPALRKSKYTGRVIFTSSGSAVGGTPGWGPYNASKAALNSLCRTLANEEPDIITVAIRPGKVDTAMQTTIREKGAGPMTDKDYQIFIREHEEGKLVKPEDCGHVMAALSVLATKELSGGFFSWNSKECEPYRWPA